MNREDKIANGVVRVAAGELILKAFLKEMDKLGKRSKSRTNGDYVWTRRDGSTVSGFFNDHRVTFHVERIFVPKELARRGISKKILKEIGKAADRAELKLTAIALADKSIRDGFQKKWVQVMKDNGGFVIDIDTIEESREDDTREEILEKDKKYPGLYDELIRHPRKASMNRENGIADKIAHDITAGEYMGFYEWGGGKLTAWCAEGGLTDTEPVEDVEDYIDAAKKKLKAQLNRNIGSFKVEGEKRMVVTYNRKIYGLCRLNLGIVTFGELLDAGLKEGRP